MDLNQQARPAEMPPRVDIVVPVFNEEVALPWSIPTLCAYLTDHCPYEWRVIIADNASTDDTLATAHDLARANPRVAVLHLDQKGRGRALRAAWLASPADVVVYMDVDLSTDLRAFMPLIEPLLRREADIAIGTRLCRDAVVTRQWKRELISRGYNLLIKLLFRPCFTDAQCGFKALTRQAAEILLPRVEDDVWFFDTELLLLAESEKIRLNEVAVTWVEDRDSRVAIGRTVRDDLRGLWRVWRRLHWQHGQAHPSRAPRVVHR